MIHPHALDHLKERVAGEILAETQRLAIGSASSWEDYKHRTGVLKGLRMLDTFINELIEDKERK